VAASSSTGDTIKCVWHRHNINQMDKIHVGATYRLPLPQGFRVWKCVGEYLGGTNQEDLIGLMVLDRLNGTAYAKEQDIMLIPRCLFMAANPERC